MLHPDVHMPTMKWVDNHKGLFNVSIHSESSLHTLDEHLDKFLSHCHDATSGRIPARVGEAMFEANLKQSCVELSLAGGGPLIRFLPLILDKLISLMVKQPVIAGQVINIGPSSFEALAQVVKRVTQLVAAKNDQHGRNGLLTTYIKYYTLPQHEPMNSPTSNYATLGRPSSLMISPTARHRSTSDPDLPGSAPVSPDAEVACLMSGGRNVDRTASLRQHDQQYYFPRVQGRKLVHEEVALQWVVSSGSTRDLALSNAWFFFELIMKGKIHIYTSHAYISFLMILLQIQLTLSAYWCLLLM